MASRNQSPVNPLGGASSPPLFSEREGEPLAKVSKNVNYTEHKQMAVSQIDLSNVKQFDRRAIHKEMSANYA